MRNRCDINAVIIIEDNIDIRNFVSRLLNFKGYPIFQADDGDEGIRFTRENQIAPILLDLRLQGHDCRSVLTMMKNQLELSVIPIIILTASAIVKNRRKKIDMGVADYLVKSLSVADSNEAITRLLQDGS